MAAFMKGLFGDPNEKEIRRLQKIVDQVNELEPWAKELKDENFPAETASFKERLQQGELLDEILPEAFALAREAALRVTGMRPFDVQLMGAVVQHQGRISEMKTGEGKTLVATLPAYLNALEGKGVHIVTVNDYLARRDRGWMGPIFEFLGLKVGLVVQNLEPEQRRTAYQADITYATNNELGFDYLRDNMVLYKDDMVQQNLHYAIVDEVDSILIDEARTPLIISSRVEAQEDYGRWKNEVEHLIRKQGRLVADLLASARKDLDAEEREEASEKLLLARRASPKNKNLMKMMKEPGMERLVERTKQRLMTEKRLNQLDEELYYNIDEATRLADIKDKGYRELERVNPQLLKLLRIGKDSTDDDHDHEQEMESAGEHRHYFDQLIKAYSLFERDVDYVVQDGKVIIVDEFTGRLMPGRRYSDGLHQAIEAKEGVQVQAATRTVASITFQNYFRMYDKIAGMTGTALTEEEEFRKIYGMDVVAIPTNKPLIREEWPDLIYKSDRAKFQAVVEEIIECRKRNQPVLVGTISVEKSEMLSKMLKRQEVEHEVLNAVNHNREAYIIAQAGRRGAVTISTNMAGRGTDIILGGNPEYLVKERLEKEFKAEENELDLEGAERWQKRFAELIDEAVAETQKQREDVIKMGGLHVLGTERHESRRIDNQLRGRSGRQGDPGSSQFFVSLEDDLMRLFGGDNIASLMDRFGIEENVPIDHPLVSRGIENAQKKVESRNFEIRRNLLDYDDVLNKQREVIYSQRRRVLEGENVKEPIIEMVDELIGRLVHEYAAEQGFLDDEHARALLERVEDLVARKGKVSLTRLVDREMEDVRDLLSDEARSFYEARESEFTPEVMRELERVVLLRTVDRHWMLFIDAMHQLRHEIHTQAYAQRDPLVEYKRQSFDMFEDMIQQVQTDVVRSVYQVRVTAAPQRKAVTGEATGYQPQIAAVGGGRAAAQSVPAKSASGSAAPQGRPPKPEPVSVDKIGRNEPCPCGSGKKYKKCCGK
ncbi:MAG: preprotein translocase subunit SecA [Dethiobacteria bacterium]|nr:preprotein translocase subunit SecA [Dethiobacteria bacterium]